MNFFKYRDDELYCEDVAIKTIAEDVGTPLYIYSYRTIQNHYRVFCAAFSEVSNIVAYAVKANSNLSVLRLLANEGAGADVVSGGELYRALKAGIPADKILFAGVGKSKKEIEYALDTGILMFNVESSEELDLIGAVAKRKGKIARVGFRVNPDIDPKTHPYTSTGFANSKFGLHVVNAIREFKRASKNEHIEVVGIHVHIGSQLTEVLPFVDALKKIICFMDDLKAEGIEITYLDIGGGLGITYESEEPPHPREFADAIIPLVRHLDVKLVLEPGRVITGNAGALVSRVLYRKDTPTKKFVIVDAGMNDLLRPSLYDSYHDILPVEKRDGEKIKADVVGPICESGDFFARDRELQVLRQGDLVAVMSAGAYGFSMASNYNSRPRGAEVMVKDNDYFVVKERETFLDLIRGERIENALFSSE